MLPDRSRGLLQVHGLFLCVALPCMFVFYGQIYALLVNNFNPQSVNFFLYTFGTFLSGVLTLVYTPKVMPSGVNLPWYNAFCLANRQTLVLVILFFTLIFATKDKAISRLFVASFIGFSWGGLLLLNHALPPFLSRLFFEKDSLRNCLLIGNPALEPELEPWLLAHAKLGLHVIGYVAAEETPHPSTVPYLGKVGHLKPLLQQHKVQQVIGIEAQDSKAWMQHILRVCDEQGCRILIYNPLKNYFHQPIVALQEGVHTFFTFKEEPLENPVNRCLKRWIDLMISLGVVLFVLPILAVIIKAFQAIQAPGPLFFKQKRVGINHKPFMIYKFRSMFDRPKSEESLQAQAEDKRVFPFGKWMRRLSLDEFPQFINVLKGEMSVVGPRPHFIEHDSLFNAYIYQYRQRHFVKPGITGLAQVKGYRGEITDLELLKERTKYDLFYIDHWSLGLDWVIIGKTVLQLALPAKRAY